MIQTKEDLQYYIMRDMYARFHSDAGGGNKPSIVRRLAAYPEIAFQINLRRAEYHVNNGHKVRGFYYKYRLLKFGRKLGWTVGLNCFGPGMCIVHYGTVVVNGNATIGENARLHAGVNIGASGGSKECPKIGDNVYFGPGAKVFGNIRIASNIAIGANAVVNKSFEEEGVTLAGAPAKIVSHKGTEKIIMRYKEDDLQ